MSNVLSSHVTGARELLTRQLGHANVISGLLVLSLVDRLPPVQRRYRLELEIRDSTFAAGRAYEREVLGLPPVHAVASRTGAGARVAVSGHSAGGSRRQSARRRHLHLV